MIVRSGERVAAVVPIELLDAIDAAIDQLAAREAGQHRGDPTVSLAEVLADLLEPFAGSTLATTEPEYPFRTDPMGDEIDSMPRLEGGGGSILADIDRHMEEFGR